MKGGDWDRRGVGNSMGEWMHAGEGMEKSRLNQGGGGDGAREGKRGREGQRGKGRDRTICS